LFGSPQRVEQLARSRSRCVERGASRIVVAPFFLGPGKHWTQDIPRLTADAAAAFPATSYHVAPTLGMRSRIPAMTATASGYGRPSTNAVTPYTVPQITEIAKLPSM